MTRAIVNAVFAPAGFGKVLLLAPRPADGPDAAAAGAALENLARTTGVEWARLGIRVVAVRPRDVTSATSLAQCVAYLASPAGDYFSGCVLDLGAAGLGASRRLSGRALDLQQAAVRLARVVDLERRVLDAEALAEHRGELAAARVAVVVGRHQHVRGERDEARGHLPDVQVVDLDDAGSAGHRAADDLRVRAARGRLEQHAAGVAHEAPAAPQHQRRDAQRGDPVGGVEAPGEHGETGERGGDRRGHVGEVVQERAAHVQALAARARQRPGGDAVDGRAGQADDQHDRAVDLGRVGDPLHGRDRDQARQHEQADAVDLGAQDLGPPEAERVGAARRALRQAHGHERERDRAGVGEHVTGVGEQRQRAGDQSGDHLDDHEAEVHEQRDREPARVAARRDRMRVPAVRWLGAGRAPRSRAPR